jgi:hypothetical protein
MKMILSTDNQGNISFAKSDIAQSVRLKDFQDESMKKIENSSISCGQMHIFDVIKL